MGFTTGLLSGAALTTSTLYFSLMVHQHNRAHQSNALRQSSFVLDRLVDPGPTLPPPTERRVERGGLVEMAKDRWNDEVAKLVRAGMEKDWRRTVAWWEGLGRDVWRGARGMIREREEGSKSS